MIDDGGRNIVHGMALAGSVVTWAQLDYDHGASDTSYVVRSSTDGSTPPVVTFLDRRVGQTAILGGLTGWAGCFDNVSPARCSAGTLAANGDRTERAETRTVAGDGSRFVFDTYGDSPGVDAATAIGGSAALIRLATVGLLPPTSYAVSLGAAGVAYVDSQGPNTSVSRRPYGRSGSTVTLGSQVPLVAETVAKLVARDGRRTAYVDNGYDLWLVTDDGNRTKVFDSDADVVRVGERDGLTLSGTRLLWTRDKYSGRFCDMHMCWPLYDDRAYMVYDIRTGVNTQLPYSPWTSETALWGSYLAYQGAQNTIWRRDLSSGRVLQVKAAGTASLNSLAVHGDYVGWSTCTRWDTHTCAGSVIAYRNMATGTATVQLASSETLRVRLSGGHLEYDTYASGAHSIGTLRVLRLGTQVTGVIGSVVRGQPFDVHDQTLAWIAPHGLARIAPNSPFVASPRYLGNALGGATFTPNGDGRGDLWTPEFSISKSLPTCTITIRSGTSIRRMLSCATGTGTARVFWNGRDTTGRLLPKGRYTWTLTGRDTDGTLRWWTGSTAPIRGTVTIA